MLRLSAGTLLTMGLWPGRLRAADAATAPLTFVVVNDFHYAEDACAPFFEGLVRKINAVDKAAFVLIAGDLLDTGTAGAAHALHDILRGLTVPYYVTAGNHDSATQTDRSGFDAVFGGPLNRTFDANGWQFVGLDTSDGTKVEKFDCRKETIDFAATLPGKLDKSKPTFVYTHFPLGPDVRYRLQNADLLLEPFKQLNVAAVFNGHYHALTERKILNDVMVTTNRCCSRKRANHDNTREKGFFVIAAADGKYTRTFVEYGTEWPGGTQVGRAAASRPATRSAN
jgi:predicted phosphodiesterase